MHIHYKIYDFISLSKAQINCYTDFIPFFYFNKILIKGTAASTLQVNTFFNSMKAVDIIIIIIIQLSAELLALVSLFGSYMNYCEVSFL